MTNSTIKMKNIDLIYSPDDDDEVGRGWYFQRMDDWATSQLFASSEEAEAAMANNEIEWDKD